MKSKSFQHSLTVTLFSLSLIFGPAVQPLSAASSKPVTTNPSTSPSSSSTVKPTTSSSTITPIANKPQSVQVSPSAVVPKATSSTVVAKPISPLTSEDQKKIAIVRNEMDMFKNAFSDSYVKMVWNFSSLHPVKVVRDRLQMATWKYDGRIDPAVFGKEYLAIFGTGNPCDAFGAQALASMINGSCSDYKDTAFWVLGKSNDPFDLMRDAGFGKTDYYPMCDAMTGQQMPGSGSTPGSETFSPSASASGAPKSNAPAGNALSAKSGLSGPQGASPAGMNMGMGDLNLFVSCGAGSMSNKGGGGSSCDDKTDGSSAATSIRNKVGASISSGGGGSEGNQPFWCKVWCSEETKKNAADKAAADAKVAADRAEVQRAFDSLSQKVFDDAVAQAETELRTAQGKVREAEENKRKADDAAAGTVGVANARKEAEKKQRELDEAKANQKAAEEKVAQAKKEAAEKAALEASKKKAEEAAAAAKKKSAGGDCVAEINECGRNMPEEGKKLIQEVCDNLAAAGMGACKGGPIDRELIRGIVAYPSPEQEAREGTASNPTLEDTGVVDPYDENKSANTAMGIDPCGNIRQANCISSMPSPDGYDPCAPGPQIPPESEEGIGPKPLPVDRAIIDRTSTPATIKSQPGTDKIIQPGSKQNPTGVPTKSGKP